jgi:hypothetical protein
MIDNAIAIYCFFDDFLKKINHKEDCQRQMNDAEIMLIAFIAMKNFSGHYEKALQYMKESGLCSFVLGKSRFNRRLHAIQDMMHFIFLTVGDTLKDFNTSMEYAMDSFPVNLCHNIRIKNNHLLPYNKEYHGKCVSKREYFYGFKIQVIATIQGCPVEFAIVPGSWSDCRGMKALPMNLPNGSRNISDSGYTDYVAEDLIKECENVWLDVVRKSNSKRKEPSYRTFYKNVMRKVIENTFSQITAWFPKRIHATSINGFLLKLKLFLWSFTFYKALTL